jgi:hypothetical protein
VQFGDGIGFVAECVVGFVGGLEVLLNQALVFVYLGELHALVI